MEAILDRDEKAEIDTLLADAEAHDLRERVRTLQFEETNRALEALSPLHRELVVVRTKQFPGPVMALYLCGLAALSDVVIQDETAKLDLWKERVREGTVKVHFSRGGWSMTNKWVFLRLVQEIRIKERTPCEL